MPKVSKSYGTEGTVVVNLPQDVDINLKEPVFIKFDELPVPFFFEKVEPHGARSIVKFEDVDSLAAAEELVGREIFFDQSESDEDASDGIVGRLICDASGKTIGPVTEFLEYPGNPCIAVDYKGREVVLPIHEDLIVSITKKSIRLIIPDGLL